LETATFLTLKMFMAREGPLPCTGWDKIQTITV
jgi:hypothetical protein